MSKLCILSMFFLVATVADASRFGLLRVADPLADRSPSDRELGHESSRTLLDEEFEAAYRQMIRNQYDGRALLSMAPLSMAPLSMAPLSMAPLSMSPTWWSYSVAEEGSQKSLAAPAPMEQGSSNNGQYGGAMAGGLSAAGLALVVVAAILYKKKRSSRSAQRVATADSSFVSLPTPV